MEKGVDFSTFSLLLEHLRFLVQFRETVEIDNSPLNSQTYWETGLILLGNSSMASRTENCIVHADIVEFQIFVRTFYTVL